MGPKGNPPSGLSFFWGCMALLAVKVQIVAEPLACNMQQLCPAAGDVSYYRGQDDGGVQCTNFEGGPPMVRVDQV
jgi:hypothetical protein